MSVSMLIMQVGSALAQVSTGSADQTILQSIKQAGPVLYPLIFCSLLVLAVTLERIWAYSQVGKVPQALLDNAGNLHLVKKTKEAISALKKSPSPYARIACDSLEKDLTSTREITDEMTLAVETEVAKAKRAVPVLGTIGNLAPFIGLFGTVLGIMQCFHDVGNQGNGTSVVSTGVGEALISTAIGLGVAMCAVVANNWCLTWVENYRLELDHFATRWCNSLLKARGIETHETTTAGRM